MKAQNMNPRQNYPIGTLDIVAVLKKKDFIAEDNGKHPVPSKDQID